MHRARYSAPPRQSGRCLTCAGSPVARSRWARRASMPRSAGPSGHGRWVLDGREAGDGGRVPSVRARDGLRHGRRAAAGPGAIPGRGSELLVPGSLVFTGRRAGRPRRLPQLVGVRAGRVLEAARAARARRSTAATGTRSSTSPTRTRRPTRRGRARSCRPRRSGSSRRAAASRARPSPGATSTSRTASRWRTPGRGSSPGRT